MTTTTKSTTTPTTCARCAQPIVLNMNGGWFNQGRALAGAGHRSVFCPDGLHVHSPS